MGFRAEQRKIIAYANATLTVVDPVDSANFHAQRDKIVFAMRAAAHQSHVQMNDMSDVSGKSKQEGRAEFDKSLKRSKAPTDAAGRWIIEVALRFAAAYTTGENGQKTLEAELEKYRIDFNSIVDAGAIAPEQAMEDRTDVENGYMSVETYQTRRGIEDPDAERARLEKSEFFQLSLTEKRLTVAMLAKNIGLPSEEILKIAGYKDEDLENFSVMVNLNNDLK
jgi:hypothetical protein